MLITWRRWFWTIIVLFSMALSAGCAAQADVAESPDSAGESAADTPEAASMTQEKQLPTETTAPPTATTTSPTETAAPPVDVTATAVDAGTPTIAVEPTKEVGTGEANADIIFVLAKQESEDTWRFTVTVEHPDTGWDDYADGWDVVFPDGSVARPDPDSPFTRLLLHPHETEQPFTRSQGGIIIAPEVTVVTVRAHDIVDGFGGQEVAVSLLSNSGQNYEVQLLPQ